MHNILRKIYLNFAECSESNMIFYDFIVSASFDRLVELLENAANNPKLTKQTLLSMIDKVIRYKYKKVLHFQDLR